MKIVKKIIRKMFPKFSHVVYETYYYMMGNGFNDVITYINQKNAEMEKKIQYQPIIEYTFNELKTTPQSKDRIAFITNLPPETTGIATCSFYSLLGHSGSDIDIFSPLTDLDWFYCHKELFKNTNSNLRLLSTDLLLTAVNMFKYKAIIVASGNSNHCIYINNILKKINSAGLSNKIYMYLHDPCIFNFIQQSNNLNTMRFKNLMESLYGSLNLKNSDLLTNGALSSSLIEKKIFGLRYFDNMGIDKYIVNSQTAYDLVNADIGAKNTKIIKLFHPVFLPASKYEIFNLSKNHLCNNDNKILKIGSFGIPATSKSSDTIIKAAKILKQKNLNFLLVLAGFEIQYFVDAHAKDLKDLPVKLFEGPTDLQLIKCMMEVDVAVQLRKFNLGESTGIVPQLLALSKKVLVSDIGSFKEFGNAVNYLPPSANEDQLADAILKMHNEPLRITDINAYVSKRTPEKFREKLFDELEL